MGRRNLFLWLSCLWIAIVFALPAQAQVVKLTFAEQNSDIAWGPTHAEKPWIKNLETASQGNVKIDVFYSQTLVKGPDVWNAVKSGVADMGWCMHGYWPDMTPLSDVITLPALPIKSAEQASVVFWKLYEKFPAIQKEFQDVHVLHLVAADPRILITTRKQVKTMEDLKGMKLRILGGPPTEQMKALGAVPLLLPMPDSYLSLQKGVIDGMDISWEGILGFRLYEVVKYYTVAPLTTSYNSIIMNKAKWDSLPKDVQAAFNSVSGIEGARFWGKNWYDSVPEAVAELMKKEGRSMEKYTLPPEEAEKWRKMSAEPIWTAWVKKMESKGRPEAQQILDATLELLRQ